MTAENRLLRKSSLTRFFNLVLVSMLVSYLLRPPYEGDRVTISGILRIGNLHKEKTLCWSCMGRFSSIFGGYDFFDIRESVFTRGDSDHHARDISDHLVEKAITFKFNTGADFCIGDRKTRNCSLIAFGAISATAFISKGFKIVCADKVSSAFRK